MEKIDPYEIIVKLTDRAFKAEAVVTEIEKIKSYYEQFRRELIKVLQIEKDFIMCEDIVRLVSDNVEEIEKLKDELQQAKDRIIDLEAMVQFVPKDNSLPIPFTWIAIRDRNHIMINDDVYKLERKVRRVDINELFPDERTEGDNTNDKS